VSAMHDARKLRSYEVDIELDWGVARIAGRASSPHPRLARSTGGHARGARGVCNRYERLGIVCPPLLRRLSVAGHPCRSCIALPPPLPRPGNGVPAGPAAGPSSLPRKRMLVMSNLPLSSHQSIPRDPPLLALRRPPAGHARAIELHSAVSRLAGVQENTPPSEGETPRERIPPHSTP
jgi:hypothetical protein